MKPAKIFFALIAVALVVWLGCKFFPSNEKQIRNRLQELAETVSLKPSDGNIARLMKSQKLASFFAPEIVLQVEFEAWERETSSVTKPSDLSEHYLLMTTRFGVKLLDLRIVDVLPKIGPDKQSASVLASAIVRVNEQREPIAQELKIDWEKVNRRWVIKRLEAIRTLQ